MAKGWLAHFDETPSDAVEVSIPFAGSIDSRLPIPPLPGPPVAEWNVRAATRHQVKFVSSLFVVKREGTDPKRTYPSSLCFL